MIKIPSMIIHGDADVSSPIELTGQPTAALIPGAQWKVYPGAPHGMVFTHADQLIADIVKFLASNTESAVGKQMTIHPLRRPGE